MITKSNEKIWTLENQSNGLIIHNSKGLDNRYPKM